MNNASHYGCSLVRIGIFATTKQGRVKRRIAICLRGGFQQKEKYHRFSQLFFHSFCFCWPADVTKIISFSARATVAPFISSFISPLHHHPRALRAISIHPSLLRVSGLFGAPLPSILSTAIFRAPHIIDDSPQVKQLSAKRDRYDGFRRQLCLPDRR